MILFEWNELKRQINLQKHGIDFIDCFLVFDGRPIYSFLSSQSEDEKRWVSICLLNSKEIATIWTRREPDIIRIISMRRARNEERKKYHELYS
tara:strand:- start:129 stop:407 length:279 start_codon:yes stop_codon:yes gene_type:complete